MATKNVTIPKSYKGLKAVYITPSEEGLLRRTSHPKGSPQPKKGPGGLLMMDGEEMRDRDFAKKHGLSYKAVTEAGGSTSRKAASLAAAKKSAPKKSAPRKAAPKKSAPRKAAPRKAAPASAAPGSGTWTGTRDAPDVRGGFNPGGYVDYTNTNPAYWASAVRYFKAHPEGNPVTGELGIWIPNLEKEGAERTALAAVAGGVTAHVDSNYSNRTVDDAKAKALHAARGDAAGAAGSYRGGAEKAIRLAGTHRGGTDVDTGYAMGSTAPSEHGAYIKGGEVVRGAGPDYVKGGGDFGGLLGTGTAINTAMLDGLLGARDSDGMRIRGTYPDVVGAATSDPTRGGGYGYGGGGISGGGPVVPTYMSDWSKFMPTNFSLGEAMYDTSGREVAPGGFLYQPHAVDYLGGMSRPGGMLGGGYMGGGMLGGAPSGPFTGTGGAGPAVTYSGAPSGFSAPVKAGPTIPSGGSTAVYAGMEGGHDPTGGEIAHSVSPMSSLASSPTLGPGAHPMSVAMALAGPMAPTSHTVAPGTYSHEALAELLGEAGAAAAEAEAAAAEMAGSSAAEEAAGEVTY